MPSILRFLVILLIVCGLAFLGAYMLATMVEPEQRPMTQTISPSRLNNK